MNRLMEMVSLVLQESDGTLGWEEFRLEMTDMLVDQGYRPLEINIAMAIAQRIHEQLLNSTPRPAMQLKSNRIFQIMEEHKLSTEARGYLESLVQQGYISQEGRVDIVDRLLMLDEGPIELDELKSLIQMYVDEEAPDDENCWIPPTLH